MAEEKDDSPNKDIDKALKMLMKAVTKSLKEDSELAPDEIKAKVAVISTAINWEKAKHNIRDGDTFDPSFLNP